MPISITFYTWLKLVLGLRSRGQKTRESGAFLIGSRNKIRDIIFYDKLDPNVSNSGIIEFDGSGHLKLSDILIKRQLEVIADIHTHPGQNCNQSYSDQKHPMQKFKGHVAIIAPNFGHFPWYKVKKCSAYKYLGAFKWQKLENELFPIKLRLL